MNLENELRRLLFTLGDLHTHRSDVDRNIARIEAEIAQVRSLLAKRPAPEPGPAPAPPQAPDAIEG